MSRQVKAVAHVDSSPFAKHILPQLRASVKLLEVGCGNGRDAIYFSRAGHQVTAVDVSPAAINLCREIYNAEQIRFVHGTASALLAQDAESFDVIYSRFVVHAMTRPEEKEFLDAAARLLKPNGIMYVECRSINDPLSRQGEIISTTERLHGHYRRFIVSDEFKLGLAEAGFELIDEIESNGLAIFGDEDPVVIRVSARRKLP